MELHSFKERIAKVFAASVAYDAGDPKRIQHFLKVYAYAAQIGFKEGLSEREQEILEVAALLHDIGIHPSEAKYGSSAGKYQEIEGPIVARPLLEELGFDEELIERVCFLIAHHHTYAGVEGRDWQILLEADFLVNAFEDGTRRESILAFKEKIFKTEAGKELLDQTFGLK